MDVDRATVGAGFLRDSDAAGRPAEARVDDAMALASQLDAWEQGGTQGPPGRGARPDGAGDACGWTADDRKARGSAWRSWPSTNGARGGKVGPMGLIRL